MCKVGNKTTNNDKQNNKQWYDDIVCKFKRLPNIFQKFFIEVLQ